VQMLQMDPRDATRCLMRNVLNTEVDAQCNKLVKVSIKR